MTTAEMSVLLRVAEEEIRSQQDAHPEIAYAVNGTATIIRVGLAHATAIKGADWVRRGHLAQTAQSAAQNLQSALDRRPHLLESAELLRDAASSLLAIADAGRVTP